MTPEIKQAAQSYVDAEAAMLKAREAFYMALLMAWKTKSISQTKIARALQCSTMHVSDVMRGNRSISADLAGRLLDNVDGEGVQDAE
jgi:predicted XRE-type DNA-binding protein